MKKRSPAISCAIERSCRIVQLFRSYGYVTLEWKSYPKHPQASTTPPTSTFTGMMSNPLGQGGERGWDLTQVLVKCP